MLVSDECTSGIWRHQTKITDISINTTYIHKTVIKLLSRKDFARWLCRAFTLPQEARWSLCTSWWRRRHQSNRDAAGWGCPASPGTEHWPPFPPEWGQRLRAAAEDKDKQWKVSIYSVWWWVWSGHVTQLQDELCNYLDNVWETGIVSNHPFDLR